MSPPTPARRLVEAFGDCDAMAAMYTDDVTWAEQHQGNRRGVPPTSPTGA